MRALIIAAAITLMTGTVEARCTYQDTTNPVQGVQRYAVFCPSTTGRTSVAIMCMESKTIRLWLTTSIGFTSAIGKDIVTVAYRFDKGSPSRLYLRKRKIDLLTTGGISAVTFARSMMGASKLALQPIGGDVAIIPMSGSRVLLRRLSKFCNNGLATGER